MTLLENKGTLQRAVGGQCKLGVPSYQDRAAAKGAEWVFVLCQPGHFVACYCFWPKDKAGQFV